MWVWMLGSVMHKFGCEVYVEIIANLNIICALVLTFF